MYINFVYKNNSKRDIQKFSVVNIQCIIFLHRRTCFNKNVH